MCEHILLANAHYITNLPFSPQESQGTETFLHKFVILTDFPANPLFIHGICIFPKEDSAFYVIYDKNAYAAWLCIPPLCHKKQLEFDH